MEVKNAAGGAGDTSPEKKPASLRYRLKLDEDGIYWGAVKLEADDAVADEAIVFDHEPDNPPGRYRWNPAHERLDPLLPQHVKLEDKGIDFERALYELAKTIHQLSPSLVSAITIRWCEQYEQSLDANNGGLLKYFRDIASAATAKGSA